MKTIADVHPNFLAYLEKMMEQVNNNLVWEQERNLLESYRQSQGEKIMLDKIIKFAVKPRPLGLGI